MGKLHRGRGGRHRAARALTRDNVLLLPTRERRGGGAALAESPVTRLVAGSLALAGQPATVPQPAPRAVAARHQILIVEDDAIAADAIRSALELDGDADWSVAVASDGLRALDLLAHRAPDVLLLDVRLPGLDGGEVYRRLRAGDPAGRTRVLFLSAATSLDLHRQGIDDGVLLRKPFDVQDLVALVRALVAR
ncbi:MAG TPA: response regulator [Ktedonobacterales bacterium]|jgi:CheY-like chemotaxis protein